MLAPRKRRVGRPSLNEPRAPRMTARQFNAWQATLGLTDSQAARHLGTSPSTIARYRSAGGPALLGLACAAVAAGLSSWNNAK
jgi:DNA-binding CsgD family transcriptional regulator